MEPQQPQQPQEPLPVTPPNPPSTDPVAQPEQAPVAPVAPVQSNPSDQKKVPFYRSYWVFAAIYLILPPIIGLAILFSGDVFRKQKDGTVKPISKKEKLVLTIVAFLLWIYAIFLRK